jgi:hypothetical protein
MPTPYSNMADAAGDAVRKILAYHGSPHDFNKFDATKIGSGQGETLYGHGLYFASNPKTATAYRRTTAGTGLVDSSGNQLPRNLEDLLFAENPGKYTADWSSSASNLANKLHASGNTNAASALRKYADDGIRNAGREYEVQIAHDPLSLLTWEKQMRKQPRVLEGLLKAAEDMPETHARNVLLDQSQYMQGRDAYNGLVRVATDALESPYAAKSAVSKALSESGVPGIQYWDDFTNHSTAGSRNYVMFPGTEDSISILRKYGLLPAVGAGAAAMSQNPAQTSE